MHPVLFHQLITMISESPILANFVNSITAKTLMPNACKTVWWSSFKLRRFPAFIADFEMFVVPDVPSQFSHHEYWDRFYESLSSTQNFEWYMEWDELRKVALDMFLRGSKEKQLLELGCGNSNLSMKMSEAYPNLKITAIDIADEAVERTKQSCSAIKCLKMDATKMQFGDAEFDIVFDKGTLDTLYCDRQLGDKMLDEVYRVLRPCGLYISISLAQKNVLSSWIERMSSLRCILKVMALPSSKHLTYPAFAFIAMKPFNATSAIPQTLSWSDKRDNQPPKKFTVAEIMKLVANLQSTCMALMQLREDKDLVEMEFCVPGRAKLIVHNSFVTDPKIPFAAFAVPCSPTSNSWHYTSKKGRRQIAKEASVGRLVFIFRVDEAVGVDLSKLNVSQDFSLLMPTNLNSSTYKTPVLSTQEKLFESKEVYRSESGTAVVHDLTYIGSAQKFRRLTFEDSLAQTEMRIGANKSVVYDADAKGYIQVMSWLIKVVAKASSTLIIGLGGGELCHGITYENPECKMIAIDVSTDVIEIAKKCFGLEKMKNVEIFCEDGIQFLKENDKIFDAVVLDVSQVPDEDGLTCPFPDFIEEELFKAIRRATRKALLINFLDLSEEKHSRKHILDLCKANFASVLVLPTGIDSECLGDNDVILALTDEVPPFPYCKIEYIRKVIEGKMVV